ncbi:helix-turn-helix transcriptional regulator [Kutzneria sp. CA-103260]|uniref:helix-turn-helix transcriptional regulator n=1 Tax=Kutzneria sp. CA-103260 TaxID=2802641 RepID=UPI001BA7B91C|nr:LuxR family transcriptional regulator [Kutzneria sp. CA-103260]QUQ69251.1 LuxR family transcriptional regulator [Kutzneria sp. CA-103260]
MPRIGSGIPLVARRAELAVLESALAAAAEGQASAVLLAGDAGVGKSRLLTELTSRARDGGVKVLTGRCLDVEGAGLPYLPFVEALGRLPESGASRLDDAMDQLRLFEAVHTELAELAADDPVLLALEDLHWADAATRDLLLFLVSRLNRQRLLVVVTYRMDDLHRRHPLRPLLTELGRLSTVDRVDLRPFDRADAMAFVSALSDGTLPAATLQGIADRSEGNAFFCEELTAAYGTGVPDGLTDLLLARVERLGRNARRVVRAASGAGTDVEHSALQAVTELDADDLDEALRESVQHNVLVAADNGYAFRHALLREAVYGDLLPGERVRLHASYARLVTTPASLAYHALQSHDLPAAFAASVRAAEQAATLLAPAEALHHVEQALQLFSATRDPGVTEYFLQRLASRMALAAGDGDRAIAYARAAVSLADDPETGAEARHELAVALIPLEYAGAEVAAAVSEAWDLVRDRPPSVVRARMLALRAREWAWYGGAGLDLGEMEQLAEQARAAAVQLGAEDVEIDTLVTLAVFAEWSGRHEEAYRLYRAAASRAAAAGAYTVELRSLKNFAVSLIHAGRFREAVAVLAESVERATAVGLTWSEYAVEARIMHMSIQFKLGDRTTTELVDDHSAAPRWAALHISAANLHPLALAGRFEEVEAGARRIMASTDDTRTIERVRFALAEAAVLRGDPRSAVDECERLLGWFAELPRAYVDGARHAGAIALTALADLAEQAWRRRDDDAARDALAEAERLHETAMAHGKYSLENQWLQEMRNPEVLCMEARMAAELGRLRGEDDVALWRAAVDAAERMVYWQAVARWRLADALLADGRRDEATVELRAAHDVAVHMGLSPLRQAIEASARRGRIAVADVEPDSEDLLTPRERTVLELVASGLTNRQVGEQLYISEKTASVHLSRVMAKLGAGSRTEAVSLAYDRGLLA